MTFFNRKSFNSEGNRLPVDSLFLEYISKRVVVINSK